MPGYGSIALTPERPWPGPAAYTERDKPFFFGRETEAVELHRLIRAEPLAVLVSVSGLGKTSLIEAGLFPRIRAAGWLPILVRLHFALDAPPLATQVLDAAATSARLAGLTVPQWQESDTLWQAFHRRGQLFWGSEPEPVTPVLVFDQFEECFTLGEGNPSLRERTADLLAQLSDLIVNRIPPAGSEAYTPDAIPIRVVLSLREDYLASLEGLRRLFPGLRRARLRLLPFTGAQAREVVERPAATLLGDGAADAILDTFLPPEADREDAEADPALLSLFCWQLNEQRLAAGLKRLERDRIAGSRDRILRDFYIGAFSGLENSAAVQRWVEESLVDAGGYRQSCSWRGALAVPGITRHALQTLVDRRLLHPVDRPGAPSHLELTDDRLREVVVESRQARRTQELRQQLIRTQLVAAVMALLFCLALATTVWAIVMNEAAHRARRDTAEQLGHVNWLSAVKQRDNEKDPFGSGHLFLKAASGFSEAGNAVLTKSALLAAKLMTRALSFTLPHSGSLQGAVSVRGAVFDQDENRILTWGTDGTVQLWEVSRGKWTWTPKLIHALKHPAPVIGAAFDRDERRILTWSEDGQARLWDVDQNESDKAPGPIQSWEHKAGAKDPVFNRDKSRFLTWSADGKAHLWSVGRQKELIRTFNVNASVAAVPRDKWAVDQSKPVTGDVSLNGALFDNVERRILTWANNGLVQLWALDQQDPNRPVQMFRHAASVNGAVFDRGERRILSWSDDGTACLWALDQAGPIRRFIHKKPVNGAIFDRDEHRVLTWSDDGTACLWALDHDELIKCVHHEGPVEGAIFDRDERRILTRSDDGTACLWALDQADPIKRFKHKRRIKGAMFNRDEDRILTWSDDGTARLWVVDQADPIQTFEHSAGIRGAIFTYRNQNGVLTWSDDGTARFWILDQITPVRQFERNGVGYGVAPHYEPSQYLTVSNAGTVQLWVPDEKQPVRTFQHTGLARGAVFDRDERRILSWSDDGTACLWTLDQDRPIRCFNHNRPIKSAMFDHDENRILTWSDNGTVTVRLWVLDHEQPIWRKDDRPFSSAAVSPDGSRILLSSPTGAELWALDHEQPIWSFKNDEPLEPLSGAMVSADRNRIFMWSYKGILQLWSPDDNKRIWSVRNDRVISGIVISPDGRWILTWSEDGTVQLWAPDHDEPVRRFKHGDSVRGVVFNRDGRQFLSWSADGTVCLWVLDEAEPIHTFLSKYQIDGVTFTRDQSAILIWNTSGTAMRWQISLDEKIPVDEYTKMPVDEYTKMLVAEYTLEFEVRSATQLLGSREYKTLGLSDWEDMEEKLVAKKKELEKMRTGKASNENGL